MGTSSLFLHYKCNKCLAFHPLPPSSQMYKGWLTVFGCTDRLISGRFLLPAVEDMPMLSALFTYLKILPPTKIQFSFRFFFLFCVFFLFVSLRPTTAKRKNKRSDTKTVNDRTLSLSEDSYTRPLCACTNILVIKIKFVFYS